MSSLERVIGKLYRRFGASAAFLLIGATVIAVGVFLGQDLRRTNRQAKQLNDDLMQGLKLISDLQDQIQEARLRMLYTITEPDTNRQIEYLNQAEDADALILWRIEQHESIAGSSPEQDLRKRFQQHWLEYTAVRKGVIGSILSGSKNEAIGSELSEEIPAFSKVSKDLKEIKGVYERRAEDQRVQLEQSSDRSLIKLILILCLTQLGAIVAVRAVQRGKMLSAVQRSESRLREVIETIHEGMFVIGVDWKVEIWNEAAERSLGRPRSSILGQRLLDVLPELGETPLAGAINRALKAKRLETIKDLRLTLNDNERIFEAGAFPFQDGVTVFFNDVTDRKRAEAALWESEERYRDLVQGLDAIVWEATSPGLEFTFVSERAEAILGYPIEAWRYDADFWSRHIHPEDRDAAVAQARSAALVALDQEFEYRVLAADGRIVWLRDMRRPVRGKNGQASRIRGIMVDVTEHKKMQEELLRADKLESVGILAGGIAHDFNNILTAVLGNVSLARMMAKNGEKMLERLSAAERACLRAKDLTQQLLTFSKGGAPIRRIASIGELVRESAGFALSGSSVRCAYHIPEDLAPVEVDEGQFSRVIQNLVINAKQAMPDGGLITFQSEEITVDPEQGLPLGPGKYIKLSISDQGVGITQEELPKVFDPYFTTKQNGNGLGLATAYSIIKKHDGHITVESEIDRGATFTIYLPASAGTLPAEPESAEPLEIGRLKVLVMDDEETIREVAQEILSRLGFETELASDGAEAVERYKQARDADSPFDVVILDLTVPGGMGGEEAINRLHQIDPNVRAIVSSGYSNDPVVSEFRRYGFHGVVAKPYQVRDLTQTLRSVMTPDAPQLAIGCSD